LRRLGESRYGSGITAIEHPPAAACCRPPARPRQRRGRVCRYDASWQHFARHPPGRPTPAAVRRPPAAFAGNCQLKCKAVLWLDVPNRGRGKTRLYSASTVIDASSRSNPFLDRRRRRCGPNGCPRARARRQKGDHPQGARPLRRAHLVAAGPRIWISSGGRRRVRPWDRTGDPRPDARGAAIAFTDSGRAVDCPHRRAPTGRGTASSRGPVLPSVVGIKGRSAYCRVLGDALWRSAIWRIAAGNYTDGQRLRCRRPPRTAPSRCATNKGAEGRVGMDASRRAMAR
jgi:hypothetical protein